MSLFFAPRLRLRNAAKFASDVAYLAVKRGYDGKDFVREIENLLAEVADRPPIVGLPDLGFSNYKITPEDARQLAKQAAHLIHTHRDKIERHVEILKSDSEAREKGIKPNYERALAEVTTYIYDKTHLTGHFKE